MKKFWQGLFLASLILAVASFLPANETQEPTTSTTTTQPDLTVKPSEVLEIDNSILRNDVLTLRLELLQKEANEIVAERNQIATRIGALKARILQNRGLSSREYTVNIEVKDGEPIVTITKNPVTKPPTVAPTE